MYTASRALIQASIDYRWLLDRGYPEKASIKLVGDKQALDRDERIVLFRGICGSAASERRRALLAPAGEAARRVVLVDGYNQIYAAMHYLAGKPVFISTDGLLRDAGAAHGRVSDPALFDSAVGLLAKALSAARAARVEAWFDAPVPFSAAHARSLWEKLSEAGIESSCLAVKSADFPLKGAGPGTLVATSDSGIVDAFSGRAGDPGNAPSARGEKPKVFDAARFAIETAFGPRPWLDLGALLPSEPSPAP